MAVLFFGRGVLGAPSSKVVGDAGSDKTIFMWSFVWWPHALAHGHDPFHAGVVWAPGGLDLSWATTAPGASVLGLPVTLAFGPVVAYNTLALGALALAACTGFLLARWVTASFWPSLVGGYLFGFSSYEIGQTVGHLHLTLVFLVPVCVLLVLRRFAAELGARSFVIWLALALVGQFLFSTEVFLTLSLVSVVALAIAWWRLEKSSRETLRTTIVEVLGAYLLAAVLLTPYLAHAFVVTKPPTTPLASPNQVATDLLNFVFPTRRTWLQPPFSSDVAGRFTGNGVEQGAYLGLPLLVVLGLFVLHRPRSRGRSILLLTLAAVAAASLGARIRAAGQIVGVGPWEIPAKLPVTENALPGRLAA